MSEGTVHVFCDDGGVGDFGRRCLSDFCSLTNASERQPSIIQPTWFGKVCIFACELGGRGWRGRGGWDKRRAAEIREQHWSKGNLDSRNGAICTEYCGAIKGVGALGLRGGLMLY